MESIENVDAYVETIDENGNIEVELSETTDEFLQAFTIRAKRKKLRRLKDVAAYNVAQYLSCQSDVEDLQLPISLRKLVRPFVITIFGDYIFDLNENCNKRIVKYKLATLHPVVRLPIFFILTRHLPQHQLGRSNISLDQ